MTAKRKSIFLPVLLSLAIISMLTASLTLGRYTEEAESEGIYSGDLVYIVSNQVEIESVKEFFTAIENGYNNIKIKDDVDNPLVISGGISDVNSDLVIDLNGHEIQRNNREPLLNVTQGVKLTIIDTSEKQTGSFYNPVGSVLRISGGSLTVSAGEFESGPRSREDGAHLSEYYIPASQATLKGAKIDAAHTVSKLYYEDDQYYDGVSMPVILPDVDTLSDGNYSVNGNMYFSEEYNNYISADTYLYFTLVDSTVENATIAAEGSADYFYTYYLNRGTFTYAQTQEPSDFTVQIKVYVYNGVKSAAATTNKPFSAIEMESGNLFVRGGTYRSYFGVRDTYCVNASGGYMAIEEGDFYAYGRGVCVQCDYAADVNMEEQYLRVSSGDFYSEAGDTIGVSGGRMVVSDASFVKNAVGFEPESDTRNVNGSAIRVSGGSLSVSATSEIRFSLYGSGMSGITAEGENASVSVRNVKMNFYSRMAGIAGQEDPSDAAGILYNTGIFAAGGGSVVCDGNTSFNVIGSYSSGIYSEGGTIDIIGDTFNCFVKMAEDGQTDKELSSTAISTVGGSIDFNVKEAYVSSNGLGITVGGGNIRFSHTEKEIINIATTRGTAIYVYDGEVSVDENSTVSIISKIDPSCSWAADTSGGSTGITDTNVNINNGVYINGGSLISAGEIKIQHTGVSNRLVGFGLIDSKIKSYAVRVDGQLSSGTSTIDAKKLTVNVFENGGGLFVKDGSIVLDTAEIDAQGFGIAMRGESGDNVTVNTALTLTSHRTTGIYITGGSLTLNGETTVNSAIDANYVFCEGADLPKDSFDGVFVENGSLNAKSSFTVNFSGLSNNPDETFSSMIKSYAVRVDGSGAQGSGAQSGASFEATNLNLFVNAGADGGGLYVNRGTITLVAAKIDSQGYGIALHGESNTDSVTISKTLTVNSARTTGIYIMGGSLTLPEGSFAQIVSVIDEGYHFCKTENNFTVSYDGVFVEGGSLYANGTFNVTHTGIDNLSDTYGATYKIVGQQIRSYAVRVKETSDQKPTVNILKGTITNSIGGGVYVSGGTVTLGNAAIDELRVETTGTELYDDNYYDRLTDVGADSWWYYLNKQGGHAIEVQGGSLTVNSGTYTAAQGNGIFVRNTDTSAVSNNVTINGGFFYGYNTGYRLGSDDRKVGPGASAGLYVMGHSLTVTINGGTFGNKGNVSNSAASFFGTPGASRAQVYIKGGNFYGSKSDVMSVFRFVYFEFDASDTTKHIMVENANGNASAALSVQDDLIYKNYTNRGSTINISNGTFNGTGYGIYYGSNVDTLEIKGGNFIGNSASGLHVAVTPETYPRKIILSGGFFQGGSYAVARAFGVNQPESYDSSYILMDGYEFSKNGSTEWTVVYKG